MEFQRIKADINKILEIDLDTERKNGSQLFIRQASAVMYHRERQPDPETDVKDDIVILGNALGACILKAEQDGDCKPGEAMKYAINLLNDLYTDATAEVTNNKLDKNGNKITTDESEN